MLFWGAWKQNLWVPIFPANQSCQTIFQWMACSKNTAPAVSKGQLYMELYTNGLGLL